MIFSWEKAGLNILEAWWLAEDPLKQSSAHICWNHWSYLWLEIMTTRSQTFLTSVCNHTELLSCYSLIPETVFSTLPSILPPFISWCHVYLSIFFNKTSLPGSGRVPRGLVLQQKIVSCWKQAPSPTLPWCYSSLFFLFNLVIFIGLNDHRMVPTTLVEWY